MRFKLDNKGFSLVEVLIGITIMAIITVPLAHAFLTSAKTSAKAQGIHDETVAAQNILEAYEASDMETILNDGAITFAGGFVAKLEIRGGEDGWTEVDSADYGDIEADGPGYRLTLTNIDGEYDAVLTLVADGIKYGDINEKAIVDAKPMSAIANVSSPLTDETSPDAQAASEFAWQAEIDSAVESLGDEEGEETVQVPDGYASFYDYFLYNMYRTIEITLSETEDDLITALFKYTTAYSNDYYFEKDIPILCDAYEAGDYGLFFFYYPNLNTALSSDVIEIYNQENLEMNVYLVLQGDAYQEEPVIKLYETHGDKNNPMASVNANFTKNIIFYPKNGVYSGGNATNGTLGGAVSQNRIYEVTVDLYEADTGFKDVILSIDASSVE